MAFLPIVLGVRPASGAGNSAGSRADALKEKALRRDDYTCRFCGFRSQKYQRVIPSAEAGDPPFATLCTFCEQCILLERAGTNGAGLLIWLPEIGQAELNHIVRAIYVARLASSTAKPVGTLATRALDSLTARRAEAKKRLGSDDPILLATILHESLTNDERMGAVSKLDGIRLLPSEKYIIRGPQGDVNLFPEMVKYWCSPEGPYAKIPTSAWPDMFKKASEAVGHA